ncbi:MAG: hypothetical protein ACFFDK_01760 [Promethearchaeota archaeon]
MAEKKQSANIKIEVKRFKFNPIIYPQMDESLGNNIAGPSLIRVPKWISEPLGHYYLYFSAHKGDYIRLAYADKLEGPWHIYKKGTLRLEESLFPTTPSKKLVKIAQDPTYKGPDESIPHIASPDVHVLDETKEIRMYYHGLLKNGRQMTRVARSKDGIHFVAEPKIISFPYLRVFNYDTWYYGMCMPGIFYRSQNGIDNFEQGPILFNRNMRHSALRVNKDQLQVFWTQVGDSPERILLSIIQLTKDWKYWEPTHPIEVLRPEKDWEGGNLEQKPSFRGAIIGPVCQLRDPTIYEEKNKIYLLYIVAGEFGIAISELKFN